MPDILLGLIWVQTVCKDNQQTAPAGKELSKYKLKILRRSLSVMVSFSISFDLSFFLFDCYKLDFFYVFHIDFWRLLLFLILAHRVHDES